MRLIEASTHRLLVSWLSIFARVCYRKGLVSIQERSFFQDARRSAATGGSQSDRGAGLQFGEYRQHYGRGGGSREIYRQRVGTARYAGGVSIRGRGQAERGGNTQRHRGRRDPDVQRAHGSFRQSSRDRGG